MTKPPHLFLTGLATRPSRLWASAAGALLLATALVGGWPRAALAGPPAKAPVAGRSAPHAKKATTDEDRLAQAQAAYLRGERALAIDIAMAVAEHGGSTSERAWHFIGLAACSVRAHRLATRAYSSLGDNADRQQIISVCAVNGLKLAGDQFTEN